MHSALRDEYLRYWSLKVKGHSHNINSTVRAEAYKLKEHLAVSEFQPICRDCGRRMQTTIVIGRLLVVELCDVTARAR